MTRVLISADMEGATGTVLPADVEAGTPRYERFRRLLTQTSTPPSRGSPTPVPTKSS